MKPNPWLRPGVPALALCATMLGAGPLLSEESAEVLQVTADSNLEDVIRAGEAEYMAHCRVCHGSRGTAGVPLAQNDKVKFDYSYLAWTILTGPGYMPEFAEALTDDQIAKISTFILNSWGNEYGLVTAADIASVR